jgi:hypothetical protein
MIAKRMSARSFGFAQTLVEAPKVFCTCDEFVESEQQGVS